MTSSLRAIGVGVVERLPARFVGRVGGSRRLRALLRPFANRMLPSGETVVTVRSGPASGLRLAIDPQLEKFYWTGSWEPHVQAALAQALKPGGHYWDVGAHVGFFALLGERLVRPGGRVVAFEPIPENRLRLATNVNLNDARVTIDEHAVGGGAGSAQMTMQSDSSFMWALDAEDAGGAAAQVDVTTLDASIAVYGYPDLVQIDVEEAELDVLRGGEALISARRTTFLVEFSYEAFVSEARALMPGYRFTLTGANHWLIEPLPQQ